MSSRCHAEQAAGFVGDPEVQAGMTRAGVPGPPHIDTFTGCLSHTAGGEATSTEAHAPLVRAVTAVLHELDRYDQASFGVSQPAWGPVVTVMETAGTCSPTRPVGPAFREPTA